MSKLKKGMALFISLIMLFTLISCSGKKDDSDDAAKTEEKPEELYSMVVFSKGSEYFNWTYAGFVDAAKSIGSHIKTELVGPPEVDAAAEAKAMEQLIAKDVDGIAVTSADSATLVSSINKAIDDGIPVISFDVDSPDSKRLTLVGTDNVSFGEKAAEIANELVDGEGQVAILYVPGNVDLEKRLNGFKDKCAEEYPGVEVVAELNHEGEVVQAEKVTMSLLQSNPDIDVIFVTEGLGAAGVAAAVRSLDMGDNVDVIASDFNTATNDLMEAGEVAATIVDDPYFIGYYAFLNLHAAAHPTDRPSDNPPFGYVVSTGIYCPISGVMAEDLADGTIADKYLNPPSFD
ncbi:MAG TPA: sugar ABC transporter substrate-binding protein [Clostridiaceae bacterium]|nr:sugar ABC transporter substrate-binding protein [Clostridiaceae bacterium]